MNVLIISFFNEWITHLGTELELAQLHLDQGHRVAFLECDGSIGACLVNAGGDKRICDECRLRRSVGTRMLRSRVPEYQLKDYLPPDVEAIEQPFVDAVIDAESAKLARFRGHDLGWAALSTTIMRLRDSVCDSPLAKTFLKRFARASLRSYLGVDAFLKAQPSFDRVYIFNGRFSCSRGAFRACQEHGVAEIMIHERGSSSEKYELFSNSLPHSREWWRDRIERAWVEGRDDPARESTGRAYFESRRKGAPADWKSFVAAQEAGLLPEDWDGAKTNIGIFTSSEDEFAGIGDEWRNPIYGAQSEGVRRLVGDALVRYPRVHFYMRMHPNLAGVDNPEVNKLRSIESPNLTLIDSTSKISSYALVDAVDRVVTFGSTVGIEATYWGKVSVLAGGPALYEHLDVVQVARTHDELVDLIGAELAPKSIQGAIKFGYCMQTFGHRFVYWQAEGFEDGRFRGRSLKWEGKTYLERRILMKCLDAGVHTPLVHDVVSGASTIAHLARINIVHLARKARG